jgi:hypothetical protein
LLPDEPGGSIPARSASTRVVTDDMVQPSHCDAFYGKGIGGAAAKS